MSQFKVKKGYRERSHQKKKKVLFIKENFPKMFSVFALHLFMLRACQVICGVIGKCVGAGSLLPGS